MTVLSEINFYIYTSLFLLFGAGFLFLEAIINKRKTNKRLIFGSVAFILALCNFSYVHIANPAENYRVSSCKATEQINSENIQDFVKSCVLYSFYKYDDSSVETTDSGNLIIQGIPREESELIQSSYKKVIDFIDKDKENGVVISGTLNKISEKMLYSRKNVKFATKEQFERGRLSKLIEEFTAEKRSLILPESEYETLVDISNGTYKGSLTLSEVDYYQSKVDLFYNADAKVRKWHDYVEKTCARLKEPCLGLKASVVDLKKYTSRLNYLTATRVLSNTRLAIGKKINSDFNSVYN